MRAFAVDNCEFEIAIKRGGVPRQLRSARLEQETEGAGNLVFQSL